MTFWVFWYITIFLLTQIKAKKPFLLCNESLVIPLFWNCFLKVNCHYQNHSKNKTLILLRSCVQLQDFNLKHPVVGKLGEELVVFDKWTQRVVSINLKKKELEWNEKGKIDTPERFGIACAVLNGRWLWLSRTLAICRFISSKCCFQSQCNWVAVIWRNYQRKHLLFETW